MHLFFVGFRTKYALANVEPGHLRVHRSLVEEDQALPINEGLDGLSQLAPGRDVRPVLLGGAQRFFE